MGNDVFEIILYAAVALFLIYRLWLVLGNRDGFEPTQGDVGLDSAMPHESMAAETPKPDLILPDHLTSFVGDLKKRIPDFRLDRFVELASDAFDIILKSYASGDDKTLESLVKPDLLSDFKDAIEERRARSETLTTTLVRIESARVTGGNIAGNSASITVEFVTEQIHVITDKMGNVISGSPKQSEQLTDEWTFEKDLTARAMTWYLRETSP